MYPCQLAMEHWSELFICRRVLLFVDNDGARGTIIKGSSISRPSAAIVTAFWEAAVKVEAHIWVDRVPSAANPADGPSRGCFRWVNHWKVHRKHISTLADFENVGKE